MSRSRALRGVVVAYLVVKAIVDETAAALILGGGRSGRLLGQSKSGSTTMAVGDILFGLTYLAIAVAVLRRWSWFFYLAVPILVVDLIVSTNAGAPLIMLILLAVPSTRRKLLG